MHGSGTGGVALLACLLDFPDHASLYFLAVIFVSDGRDSFPVSRRRTMLRRTDRRLVQGSAVRCSLRVEVQISWAAPAFIAAMPIPTARSGQIEGQGIPGSASAESGDLAPEDRAWLLHGVY